MSLRQRHLWIAILVTLGVWGLYGWALVSAVNQGGLRQAGFAAQMGGHFVLGLVLIAIAEGVLNLIARLLPNRGAKEGVLEKRASLEASHLSLMALITLITGLAASLYGLGVFGDRVIDWLLNNARPGNLLVLFANGLMACVVISELARFAAALVLLPKR